MVLLEPQAISCRSRSSTRICLAASRALRPYSRPACGQSARDRPSRCRGTSSARCGAARSRARAAGRSTWCLLDVAVLDEGQRRLGVPVPKFMPSSGSVRRGAPLDELVGAELVGLERVPGPLEHGGPLGLRPDAVEPVVAGDEVAARVAHDRHAQFLHLAAIDVGAKAAAHRRPAASPAGRRRCRPRGPEVFEKRPEQAAVQRTTPFCWRRWQN
jgi:hypothetical protein